MGAPFLSFFFFYCFLPLLMQMPLPLLLFHLMPDTSYVFLSFLSFSSFLAEPMDVHLS